MLIVMGKVVLKEIFLKVHINTRIYVILEFQHFKICLVKNFGKLYQARTLKAIIKTLIASIVGLALLPGILLINPDA